MRSVLVFSEFPFALVIPGQVILAGRDDQHSAVLTDLQGLAEKFQIFFKRVVPPSPLPRDRPSLAVVGSLDPFHNHSRFVNRPVTHRLSTMLVFGDDRLKYDESETLLGVAAHLRQIVGQLTRSLAERVLDRQPAVLAA